MLVSTILMPALSRDETEVGTPALSRAAGAED